MSNKKIVVIGTDSGMLLNFREDLLKSLVCTGLFVKTLSSSLNENQKIRLKSIGVSAKSIPISRNSLNIVHDIQTIFKETDDFYKKLPIKDYILSLENFSNLSGKNNFDKYQIFDYRIKDQLILK